MCLWFEMFGKRMAEIMSESKQVGFSRCPHRDGFRWRLSLARMTCKSADCGFRCHACNLSDRWCRTELPYTFLSRTRCHEGRGAVILYLAKATVIQIHSTNATSFSHANPLYPQQYP